MYIVFLLKELNFKTKARGQKKKRDYVGKIPKKIVEVIWKNSKPKAHITSAILPNNLRNLLGNFSRIITVYF